MSNLNPLFGVLRQISRRHHEMLSEPCPDSEILAELPEDLSGPIVEHIAFCPVCRKNLQIIHSGRVFTESDQEPDWDRLYTRLKASAHWILLKEKIRALARLPLELFPNRTLVPVRLADSDFTAITLTVFEINLTDLSQLSADGLRITRLEPVRDTKEFVIEIAGFYPSLDGAEARLGLVRQDVVLTACGYRSTARDWDLIKIEKQLQSGISKPGRLSGRVEHLIRDTVWFESTILTTSTGTRLVITAPETLSDLFMRRDIWSMLLVSQSS